MSERRRNPSVDLACWAFDRGHFRLLRAIKVFWAVRNAIRYSDAAMWLSTRWLRLKYTFRPKCESCGVVLFDGRCFVCELRRSLKVRRLKP